MGTWRTLHPRRTLHAPGDISAHGGISKGKLRTQALRSGVECSADRVFATPISKRKTLIKLMHLIDFHSSCLRQQILICIKTLFIYEGLLHLLLTLSTLLHLNFSSLLLQHSIFVFYLINVNE